MSTSSPSPSFTTPVPSLKSITTCMEKYILYETSSFFYLIGCDGLETYFRVIKLNRTIIKPKSLDEILTEDPLVYNKEEFGFMLEMIHEGNKTSGGLTRTTVAYGLVGFVKFLDCYYFTLITQKKKVGYIGTNFIYSIKAAEVFAIRPREDTTGELSIMKLWKTVNRKLNKTNTDQAESRYMGLFQFIDISKDFFFSYTYDLTHTLQHNFLMSSSNAFPPPPFREMYEWNKYQTDEIRSCLGDVAASLWTLPIIHGSFQQRKFSLFGRVIDLILLARRSRHYAGTRYLKRGVSVHGKVANDCEMEQILQLEIGSQKTFASYVQMRGSIPTYWYQETSVTNPKPPILVDRIDPNYLATQEHFSDLIRRYSLPIIVLDLVKHNERRKRECIVGRDFRQAIEAINMNISPDQQIRYIALDFSRMSKNKGHAGGKDVKGAATGKEWSRIESSLGKEVEQNMRRAETGNEKDSKKQSSTLTGKNSTNTTMTTTSNTNNTANTTTTGDDENSDTEESQVSRMDVLRELEDISSWSLHETGIFTSSVSHIDQLNILQKSQLEQGLSKGYLEQRGVLRTNCIDCLDRTNVAQFAMGVRFLAVGLCALGILDSHSLDPSNAMLLGLMDMYSEMGDRIALQYGGSEAHKKVSKGAGKTKHGEFLTSIKRYYSNSFTDRVKQDAMNLFLGYFQPSLHDFNLWDIETDYFLHNRSLHPPRPDADRVLLSFTHPSNQLMITDSLTTNTATTTTTTTNNNITTTTTNDNTYPNLSEDEWNEILKKYFIRSTTITPEILQKIIKKEQMKERLKLKQAEVHEADELWWRQALFDFDTSTSWMCLPPLKETLILSYYDKVHCPDKLTSFDYELSQEFQYPYDATVFASTLKNETATTIWNRKKKKNLEHSRHRDDDDDVAGQEGNDDDDDRIEVIQRDQVEYDLFSLARTIGTKARTFVGELLGPTESTESHVMKQPLKLESTDETMRIDYSSPYYTRKLNTPYYARKFSDSPIKTTDTTKPLTNYDHTAIRKYSRYYEDGIHPEVYISENYSSSKRDFLVALENFTIDVDNVKEMERLSIENCLHETVVSGTYKGMQKSDSAKMVTSLVQSSMVFIEPALQTCILISQDTKEDDVFCAIDLKSKQPSTSTSASTSAASPPLPLPHHHSSSSVALLSTKSVKSIGTVDLPTSAKSQIENILIGSGKENCNSLEEDILNYANKYLYDQLIYSREIDDERLSTRLSSFTSELDILNYMSLYSNDLIALDMNSIHFMLTDRSSTKPLHHLHNELMTIQTLQHTMNQLKDEIIHQFYENSINQNEEKTEMSDSTAAVTTIATPTDNMNGTNSSMRNSHISLNWNEMHDSYTTYFTPNGVSHLSPHEDYHGFIQTGPNVYAKIANPHFLCNEKTVSSYVLYKKSDNRMEYKE